MNEPTDEQMAKIGAAFTLSRAATNWPTPMGPKGRSTNSTSRFCCLPATIQGAGRQTLPGSSRCPIRRFRPRRIGWSNAVCWIGIGSRRTVAQYRYGCRKAEKRRRWPAPNPPRPLSHDAPAALPARAGAVYLGQRLRSRLDAGNRTCRDYPAVARFAWHAILPRLIPLLRLI